MLDALRGTRQSVASLRVSVPWVPVLEWMAAQRVSPRLYIADRGRREHVAALGAISEARLSGATSMQDVRTLIDDQAHLLNEGRRMYGGLRFDPAVDESVEWSAFGAAYFVLPRLELRETLGRTELWLHVRPDDDSDIQEAHRVLDSIRDAKSSLAGEVIVDTSTRIDSPDYTGWSAAVDDILERVAADEFEKAVLAREARLVVDRVDPVALFDRVRTGAPNCYHIYFEPVPGHAFMSATPERLFRRNGDRLVSEAVAGTRPRGLMAVDDARLRDELLSSDKDRREHAVVGRSIVECLEPLCESVHLDEVPTEMRLRGNRHLKSAVRATLHRDVSNGALVEALHPTPAVGGYPTRAAIDVIRRAEPFDRGWYAGAMGWIGETEAELAVSIRSALVDDHSLVLYSGAGIVDGSEADAEWREIEQKIENFLSVIATPAECEETSIRD